MSIKFNKIYVDRKHETNPSPNMFFEFYSNRFTQRKVWRLTSKSKYIIYSFGHHKIYCFVNMDKLWRYLNIDIENQKELRNVELVRRGNFEYYQDYKVFNQEKYSQKNLTQGILLPFKNIAICIDKTICLDKTHMRDCSYNDFLRIARYNR